MLIFKKRTKTYSCLPIVFCSAAEALSTSVWNVCPSFDRRSVILYCNIRMWPKSPAATPIAHNSKRDVRYLKSADRTRIFHILSLASLPLKTVHFEMSSTALHYYKRIHQDWNMIIWHQTLSYKHASVTKSSPIGRSDHACVVVSDYQTIHKQTVTTHAQNSIMLEIA